jgi:hypothetical protein
LRELSDLYTLTNLEFGLPVIIGALRDNGLNGYFYRKGQSLMADYRWRNSLSSQTFTKYLIFIKEGAIGYKNLISDVPKKLLIFKAGYISKRGKAWANI